MAGPKNFGKRLPVDPKIIDEISRSPRMRAEQGPDWLMQYGGPGMYQEAASWSPAQRGTYYAVIEGYSTPEEIASVADLKESQVNSALTFLKRKGVIQETVPETPKEV